MTLRTVLVTSAAVAFLMVNVATAVVALSSARLTQKLLVAGTLLDTQGHAKTPPAASAKANLPPPPAPRAAPPPPPTLPANEYMTASCPAPPQRATSRGIYRVSADEYVVTRAAVDRVLEQAAEQMPRSWTSPERQDGKVVGVSIHGILPDGVLTDLGLMNGDTVESINGFDITSPERALEAYARLRSSDELVLCLRRYGQRRFLDYHVR